MLALAQRVHDEYVRDGEEQSAKIIAEANAERDSIIADAQKQKDTLLSQLDQERELLENKINGLRTFESEYRSNLRNHLESLLNPWCVATVIYDRKLWLTLPARTSPASSGSGPLSCVSWPLPPTR